jgi:hypothetical protein
MKPSFSFSIKTSPGDSCFFLRSCSRADRTFGRSECNADKVISAIRPLIPG